MKRVGEKKGMNAMIMKMKEQNGDHNDVTSTVTQSIIHCF